MKKHLLFISLLVGLTVGIVQLGWSFKFSWEIDKTPEGSESATVVEPVQVIILGEAIAVPSHSASLRLMRKYSVHLGPEWGPGYAYKLLQAFLSIPQRTNDFYEESHELPTSVWYLSDRHLPNDIEIEYRGEERIVTIAKEAFISATPLLAEIDGVRGRYFSQRLHRAVVRFVTDDGTDRRAIDRILEHRYGVRVNVPDYTELTRHTTGEHAGFFQEFKNEELIAIIAMLEEFPLGMRQTPGLKYLVRRLNGLPHPFYPEAAGVAWTDAGYIEFMEVAFKGDIGGIHRLILHEKAHFLWAHLFDEQLKKDWIEVGGWYENPDDQDGWSTTKQVEFVSAYAHGKNPNEDMAESISFYITNPDKLRSRSPAKYEFIQSRVMHGTRYISQIREDLTFEVYNLWPDYVYPGKIIGIDIQVTGAPEEDKQITITLRLHGENEWDTATRGYTRIHSEKGTFEDVHFYPIDEMGQEVEASHILRGYLSLTPYMAGGYWAPDQIEIGDASFNERYSSQTDFGWKLYIDSPLADSAPPRYVPNSVRLSLSEAQTDRGERYQILTAQWGVIESNGITGCSFRVNDEHPETASIDGGNGYWGEDRKRIAQKGEVEAKKSIADYRQSGVYQVQHITMGDLGGNITVVDFTEKGAVERFGKHRHYLSEAPPTIEIQTRFPDADKPELDLNAITIKAEPTNSEVPNGETRVEITFRVRDNIAGYATSGIDLRDPQGNQHHFRHYAPDKNNLYFTGDPTVYRTYTKKLVLPIGSPPGTWGLSGMTPADKADNTLWVDFTEIVRFEIVDESLFDLNVDGTINIHDLVLVAEALGEDNSKCDINNDGVVNILDLVRVCNLIGQ